MVEVGAELAQHAHERAPEDPAARLNRELQHGWPARRYGRIAALLIAAGALAAIPTYFFGEAKSGVAFWILAAIAFAMAYACYRLPWERLPGVAFHVTEGAAIGLVVGATAVAGLHMEIFYVFAVVYASFVFASRRTVALWVVVCGLGTLVPLTWMSGVFDGVDRTLKVAVVVFPVLVVTAGVLVFLRESFQAEHRRLYLFARDVTSVTDRIGRAGHPSDPGISEEASAARRRGGSSRR